ncbi:MAG: GGDEF domain-containing protein, partial [Terracidiphilus sp.]
MLPKYRCFPCLTLIAFLVAASAAAHGADTSALADSAPRTLVVDALGKGAVPIDGHWQFHLGDDPAWAMPTFDDSDWEQLTADSSWGQQSHPSYTGFAWYRRSIRLTPAPGASPNVALLIPAIDDAYQIYWNGVEVGHLGTLPPHMVLYEGVPAQTFGLGPVRTGVLAIRVWKNALASNDPSNLGGFEALPLIGSPDAIDAAKAKMDFAWLRGQQFTFGLTSLYALVSLLSLIAWVRDRKQWLLFWMSAFALMPMLAVILNGLRLPYSWALAQFLIQCSIAIREASGWFLLIWLLQLHEETRLVRFTRIAAIIGILSAAADGSLSFL